MNTLLVVYPPKPDRAPNQSNQREPPEVPERCARSRIEGTRSRSGRVLWRKCNVRLPKRPGPGAV